MREIRTVTHLNLGDNIYCVHLFRKLVDYYCGNIKFIHSLHSKYINELSNFIIGYESNIIFRDILEYTASEVIPLEMAKVPGWFVPYDKLIEYHKKDKSLSILLYGDHENWSENHKDEPGITDSEFFDKVMYRQYRQYCEFMKVDFPFRDDLSIFLDMKELLLPNKLTDNYDLLIGNSTPMSSQWNKDTYVFDYLLDRIDLSKVKVISLNPTGRKEIPSTVEEGLNLIEVGNIAINSKVIVGIHSSPYTTLINRYNYNKTKEFVVLQNWEQKFRYSNCNSVNYNTEEDFIKNYKIPLDWCKI